VNEPAATGNLERIKLAFERWNSGDREIDFDTIDPEIEMHTPLASTRGVPYRGHEGFRQWLADIDEQFEVWELRVEEWREIEGDRVLGLGALHARGRGSGVELDQPMAWTFSFRAGKLSRFEVFYDREKELQAEGSGL
jgi:ketosteroid isomerase-like protein